MESCHWETNIYQLGIPKFNTINSSNSDTSVVYLYFAFQITSN